MMKRNRILSGLLALLLVAWSATTVFASGADLDVRIGVSPLFSASVERMRPLHKGLNILGENGIASEGGAVTLTALAVKTNIADAEKLSAPSWSVDPVYVTPTVNDDGSLTLVGRINGEADVRVRATVDGETLEEHLTVTVSGQPQAYTLSFDGNTADAVSGMPESIPARGLTAFPKVYPVRGGYRFAGWAEKTDGEPVENLTVTEDTTVYAVWEIAEKWEFDRDGDLAGFTAAGAVVSDGVLTVPDAKNTLISPVLSLDADDYAALMVKLRAEAVSADGVLTLTLFTTAGDDVFRRSMTAGESYYSFELDDVRGTVTGFSLAAEGTDGTLTFDRIAFTDRKIVTYYAGTDDFVKNMPVSIRFDEQTDGALAVSGLVPERTGYKFLGFAASPDSKLFVTGALDASAEHPVSLYAVWDKNDHWEFDTYRNDFHPEGISSFSFADSVFRFRMVRGGSIDNLKTLGYNTDSTSKTIVMRLKWNVEDASKLTAIVVPWTNQIGMYASEAEMYADLSAYGSAPTDFVNVTFDGTSFKYFRDNTLQRIRFYPINQPGECEVDYIRFTDSEANIVVSGGTRKVASDDASYIVNADGSIAPVGAAVINELHLCGTIDFSDGFFIVKKAFEAADTSGFTAYTLDMEAEGVSVADTMFVGSEAVEMIDGAVYVLPKGTDVRFEKRPNTSGVTLRISGKTEAYLGDEAPQYTVAFDGKIADKTVVWTVSDPAVASVDENGVLTPRKAGKVRISAVSAVDPAVNAALTVIVKRYAFSLALEGDESIVIDGKERTYKTVFTGTVPDKRVKWSSSVPDVAAIDESTGVLKPIKPGRVTVTALSAYDGTVSARMTVVLRYAQFALEVVGPDAIGKDGRAADYTCRKTGEHTGDMTYIWSVDNETLAEITPTGRLVPKADGTVTVRATSAYDPSVYAEKTVTLTGQSGLYTVTYRAGTSDTVTGLPEPARGRHTFRLSDAVPEREGYIFLGWASDAGSITPVTSIQVEKDAEVYAIWGRGVTYEFNGGATGVASVNGGKISLSPDGYLICEALGDIRLAMETQDLDPDAYRNIVIRMAADKRSSTTVYYKTETDSAGGVIRTGYNENGYRDAERLSLTRRFPVTVGLDNWFELTLPMYTARDYDGPVAGMWFYGNADRVTNLWIDITNATASTVYVDYIRILNIYRTVSFDPAADGVTGMPETMKALFGGTVTVKEKPVRDGYRFLGWSKEPGSTENARVTFPVTDDMTLYAVWSKIVVSEDGKEIRLGDLKAEENRAILVSASANATAAVSFTDDGEETTLAARVSGRGLAVIDLPDGKTLRNVRVTLQDTIGTLTGAEILKKDVADAIAYPEREKGNPDAPQKTYDNTVTEVSSEKPLYGAQIENAFAGFDGVTEPILINFDDPSDAKMFGTYQNIRRVSVSDSLLTLRATGSANAALVTEPLGLDASSHRYAVLKLKGRGTNTEKLRLYFLSDATDERYYASNSAVASVEGDWTMAVFDMGALRAWKGGVKRLMFAFVGSVTGTFDLDWILFTDTVPVHFADIEGTKEAFGTVNREAMPFTDVKEADWFRADVAKAYRLGLVNGIGGGLFAPHDTVSVAEAITLAVRIKTVRDGKEPVGAAADGEAWYMPYVRLALQYRFITEGQFDDYEAPVSRKDAVGILYKALPGSSYTAMNYYESVPDLDVADPVYAYVLRWYNAGILTGANKAYSFLPDTVIERAELAAVICRMVSADGRVRVITEAEKNRNRLTFTGEMLRDASCYIEGCSPNKFDLIDGIAMTKAVTADPILFLEKLVQFGEIDASLYTTIRVGMKWDRDRVPNPASYGCSVFFTTEDSGYSADKRLNASWNGTVDERGIGEFVFDFSSYADKASLRMIRFDPFDYANVDFGIAYIIIE